MRLCTRTRALFARGLLLASLGGFATGCPRQPDAPDPGMGQPCEALEDCNPGAACGLLRLCVEGFCEDEASLVRACPERGAPVRPSDD